MLQRRPSNLLAYVLAIMLNILLTGHQLPIDDRYFNNVIHNKINKRKQECMHVKLAVIVTSILYLIFNLDTILLTRGTVKFKGLREAY